MNRLTWDGMEEMRAFFRMLPADLAGEARDIVETSAQAAAAAIVDAYPRRTGNLKKGVRVRRTKTGEFGALAIVESRAPHALLFEVGTQARHTKLGANRGSMPPGRVFRPAIKQFRSAMFAELARMVTRFGLTVTRDAA